MRTAEEVVDIAVAYLQGTVPDRCRSHGVDPPKAWFPHGYGHRELQADEWPAVFVDEITDSADHLDTTDEGDPVFDVVWQVAIELWVAATKRDDWVGAKTRRGALKAAVFEAVVDKPSMLAVGLVVDDTAIATDYSPLFLTKNSLPCCACEIRINVHTAETVARDVLAEPPIDVDVVTEPLDEED